MARSTSPSLKTIPFSCQLIVEWVFYEYFIHSHQYSACILDYFSVVLLVLPYVLCQPDNLLNVYSPHCKWQWGKMTKIVLIYDGSVQNPSLLHLLLDKIVLLYQPHAVKKTAVRNLMRKFNEDYAHNKRNNLPMEQDNGTKNYKNHCN